MNSNEILGIIYYLDTQDANKYVELTLKAINKRLETRYEFFSIGEFLRDIKREDQRIKCKLES